MASSFGFSGVSSGIQWRDMIDQIMLLKRQPISRLETKISEAEARSKAWSTFKGRVDAMQKAAVSLGDGSAFDVFQTAVSGLGSGETAPFSATAAEGAAPGNYQVRVLATAQREKIGGDVFASKSTALGIAGEFLVNGVRVDIQAADSLATVASRINAANTGSGASGVTASILSTGDNAHRLVLTSTATGADGVQLVDGSAGALRSLGLLDAGTAVKSLTSNGAESDRFADAVTDVVTLRGLQTAPAAANVTLGTGGGAFAVNLDLSTMSLNDIRDAINTAASGAGSAVTASVVTETVDGATRYRLDIDGTTSFTDANRILETLGVLEGQRTAVAQQVQGNVLESGASAATAATRFVDLDYGVQAGDTLTINGTRGDGTKFSLGFAITGTNTLGDLAAALEAEYDAGAGGATVSIVGGRLVVQDETAGESRLALAITANNESGATLDLGTFATSQTGLTRTIVAGADAELEIDGAYFRRSSNSVSDVLSGVTLSLSKVSSTALDLAVSRDDAKIVASAKALVDAYNGIADFVRSQVSTDPDAARPPLSGDSVLRSMRIALRDALETKLPAGTAGSLTRLAHIGIEVGKDGRYTLDETKLKNSLASDAGAVQRLFGVHGTASVSSLEYFDSSDASKPGTYAVNVTQAAARASQLGTGLGGAYVDTGAADTMTVRDTGSNASYTISLTNGMTAAQIADALQAEFNAAKKHEVRTSGAFASDAGGTPATDATTWASVFQGGSGAGVAEDDVITISGTRHDGSAFLVEHVIGDPATDTLGSLRSAIQDAVGPDATVTLDGSGRFVVQSVETGSTPFTLSISTDNAGGGSLDFGTVDVVTPGRGVARITATAESGEIRLEHGEYGAGYGFEVSYADDDGSSGVGIAASVYAGTDVQGTIGGLAATGSGQILTGAADTDAEGLAVQYTGTATGAIGDLTFSRGIGSVVRLQADTYLGSEDGSIQAMIDGIDLGVTSISDRILELEGRLDEQREALIRRFTAMETSMADAQQQSQWLTAQLANL